MPPKRNNHRTTQRVDRDMTDEEIEALMNQPLTFNRSDEGWVAQPTNEAQMVARMAAARAAAAARDRAEVPRMVARMNEKARAEELAREAADARVAEEAKEAERVSRPSLRNSVNAKRGGPTKKGKTYIK